MKIPQEPPEYDELFEKILESTDSKGVANIFRLGIKPDDNGKYYHWDKLRHLKPPHDLTTEEWWFAIKSARHVLYRPIPHADKSNKPFLYCEPDTVRRLLHEIDIHGGGEIKSSEQVTNPGTRDSYLINSLIEESITSSQLEGAATTRKVAKEMLRQNRKPRNRSEQMIVNNYNAMQFISDVSDEDLTPGIVFELHRILMEGTMDNPEAIGNLRKNDDIYVGDERDGTVIHVPPKAEELKNRLNSICDFANSTHTNTFMHPVIRAIILHFLLAYDHPFEDGNGRTARALFYWSMLKQGYWTMEYISISRILKESPARYTRSYLFTETDNNDVTYFIVNQLEVIMRAINDLFIYLDVKSSEMRRVEDLVKTSKKLRSILNYRQIALISRALKKPDSIFYVETHRRAHNVTTQTARTDLLKLEELDILEKRKVGRAFVFYPVANLEEKLKYLK